VADFKITGLGEIRGKLQAVEDFLKNPEPMQNIVDDIKEGILDKTAGGHDYRGRNFKPYSKEYAKKKKTKRPNLRVTGEMLDSIKAEVLTPQHGRVSISGGSALIAYRHTLGSPGGKIPQREFLNVTPNKLSELAKKFMDDKIQEILGR
jgi:predicted DNA binding CopG/RHH family protein